MAPEPLSCPAPTNSTERLASSSPDDRPKVLNQCRTKWTPQEFTTLVIEPTLCSLTGIPYSRAAAKLLLATALTESFGLKKRKQDNGPALSYFQVEPNTHNDVWDRYLTKKRPDIKGMAEGLKNGRKGNNLDELQYNDNYAATIARVKYFMKPESLPEFSNICGMAEYYKKHYNATGKATPQKFLEDWKHYGGENVVFRENCSSDAPKILDQSPVVNRFFR